MSTATLAFILAVFCVSANATPFVNELVQSISKVNQAVEEQLQNFVHKVFGAKPGSNGKGLTSDAADSKWKELSITFPFYHSIPLSKKEAIKTGNYSLMVRDNDLNTDFYAFKKDPRVAIGYDSRGNVAGVRISFPISDLPAKSKKNNATLPYTFDDKQIFSKATYFGTEVWYTTVLFVSQEKLKAGGRRETHGVVAEDVYVKLSGVYTAIPKSECQAGSVGLLKQACLPGMGLHYFHNMSPTMDCNTYQGLFTLYENGELMGLGFNVFGSHIHGPDRRWLEEFAGPAIKGVIPSRSECVLDWVDKYASSGIHIYLKRDPKNTPCPESTTKHVC